MTTTTTPHLRVEDVPRAGLNRVGDIHDDDVVLVLAIAQEGVGVLVVKIQTRVVHDSRPPLRQLDSRRIHHQLSSKSKKGEKEEEDDDGEENNTSATEWGMRATVELTTLCDSIKPAEGISRTHGRSEMASSQQSTRYHTQH